MSCTYLDCNLLSPSDFQCNFIQIDIFSEYWFGGFYKTLLWREWLSVFNKNDKLPHFYWSVECLLAYNFYLFSYPCFYIPTALLICIENTFWNINGHGNFVELFKKSFKFYVESGMREMTERDFEILRKEQNPSRDEFYKFIVNHYLRKFHYFYLHLTSNHRPRLLNTAQPVESQARADGESASGESQQEGSASDSKKKFTWLRKLLLKFRRRQRAWWVLILNSIRSWTDKHLHCEGIL